jgi:very-short-patch-repair endonuclease
MRYTEIDRRIEALAAKQYSAFSREQAFKAGATDRFVSRRLKERIWLRPEPAVYVLASSAGTWLQRCKIAELSVPGAALAGPAAAAIHGFEGFGQPRPELVVPANANCRSQIAVCHRYSGAKLTTVKGIRATTVAQTVFDLAMNLPVWVLEPRLDNALVGGKVTVEALDERYRFYAGRGRPGLPVMAALLDERRAEGWTPPATELEGLLHGVLDRLPSSPRIVRQAAVPWWSVQTGRVDVLLPDHRLIIEADGRRWHTRVADFDRDRWRDNQAAANGHRVLRFTWVHLRHFPDDVLALIEQTVRLAA